MATLFGNEVTRQRAGRNLPSHDWSGKLRIVRFSFLTAAGNIGDVYVLGILRKNERPLFGVVGQSATLGAGTYNVGTYSIAAGLELGAASDADAVAAGVTGVGVTGGFIPTTGVVVGNGYQAPTDEFLCITNIGTAFAAGVTVNGFIVVVGD